MKPSRPFAWRPFTTITIVLSFLVLAVTGIVLYVTPPGRFANWSEWRFIGLTKDQWQSIHTIFAFTFIVIAAIHLYFNWRALIAYLRTRAQDSLKNGREMGMALVVVTTLAILTGYGIVPFSTIMDFGESLKNSWVEVKSEPPVPHAELLTVAQLAQRVQLEPQRLIENLTAAGIMASDTAEVFADIAQRAGLSPQETYQKAIGAERPKRAPISEGGGFGRKTIGQICEQYDVNVDEGVKRLAAIGIATTEDANVREVALAHGKTPIDIVKTIVGE